MPTKAKKHIKIVDETFTLSSKQGNGILKYSVSIDKNKHIKRYSLSYINFDICRIDNGRVLGFDNCHGYHHRHFMGKEEPVNFSSYEAIADRFEKEWRILHDKIKKEFKK